MNTEAPFEAIDCMLTQLLGKLTHTPAILIDEIGDVVAANALADELFAEFSIRDNVSRMVFLDPAARHSRPEWAAHARSILGLLRAAYVRDEHHARLSTLISLLLQQSELFRRMWTARDWAPLETTPRVFHHAEMGDIMVDEVHLSSVADPTYTVLAYVPWPGSGSEDSVRLLGSLTAPPRSRTQSRS